MPLLTGIIAEGGLAGKGDMKRLLLRGPVHIRDEAGELFLEASRDATIVLAPAPWKVVNRFEGTIGALAGMRLFSKEVKDGLVIGRLDARGSVHFEAHPKHGAWIEAWGDHLDARSLAGTLSVEGPGARLVEKTSGTSASGPHIFARDLGAEGIRVHAWDGAELGARLKTVRPGFSRDWLLDGEDAEALLVPDEPQAPSGKKESGTSFRAARARVRSSADHPGSYRSADGRFHGTFDDLDEREGEDGVLAVHMEARTRLEGWSEESRFHGRKLDFRRAPGEFDTLVLDGDADAVLGRDLRGLAQEKGVAPVTTAGQPWRASGDRIVARLDPPSDRPEGALAWWARSQLVGAHVDAAPHGPPAKVFATRPDGTPVTLEGASLDFDLLKGALRADAAPEGSAVATIGSASIAGRELRGDLASGRFGARGGVFARTPRPEGELTLSAERAWVTAVVDPEERKSLPPEKRALAFPDDVLAFTAEEDVKIKGPDGVSLEADQADLRGDTLVARRSQGRVHATGREGEAWARRLEVRDLSGEARSLDLFEDATVAWTQSGTRTTIDADRIHAIAFANDLYGKGELVGGPVVAWRVTSSLVALHSLGPEGEYLGHGRVLRLYPRTGNATLVGQVDGTLTGKNKIPFAFEGPRADAKLAQGGRPRRPSSKGDVIDRLVTTLGNFERFSSSGGVHGKYKTETIEADSFDYDGHAVRFHGKPTVHVRDTASNMEADSRDWTIDLDRGGR